MREIPDKLTLWAVKARYCGGCELGFNSKMCKNSRCRSDCDLMIKGLMQMIPKTNENDQNKCKECGNQIGPEDRFCAKCGQRVRGERWSG